MKELGYGKDYEKYPSKNSPPQDMGRGGGEVDNNNDYLPEKLKAKKYLNGNKTI